MSLRCRLLDQFDQLAALEPDWDRLFALGARQEVFDTFPWARAWWRVHGPHVRLLTPVALDGERVIAIWPLVRDGSTLRFLGHIGSDYKDMVCEPGREAEAVAVMIEALFRAGGWTSAVLDNVPTRSRLTPALAALPDFFSLQVESTFLTSCPTVRLDGPEREQILHDILRKESLRRHEKKLAKLGALTFRHLTDRAEIASHLPGFFDQHVQRRALTDARSLFLDTRARSLYETVVDELDPTSTLRFGVVELDGRPVAYHFGFQLAGKFVWYKPTFDVDYWDYGPGEVLLAYLFRYVRDAGLCEFDFTIGDESFKSRFATHEEQNLQVRIYRPGVGGRMARRLQAAKNDLKVKQPGAFEWARRVAEQFDDWRRAEAPGRSLSLAAARAWRRSRGSRETLVYELDPHAAGTAAAGAGSEPFDVRQLTLSSLIDVMARTPGMRVEIDLAAARMRFKAGDSAWQARAGDTTICVAWSGRPKAADSTELRLDESATVVDGCWASPLAAARQVADGIRAIAGRATAEGMVHVVCSDSQDRWRAALLDVGGRQTGRFTPSPPSAGAGPAEKSD